MAHLQSNYPTQSTDEYGNPIQHGATGATAGHGVHDTTQLGTGTGYGTHGHAGEAQGGHGITKLSRSGSSSSSSSEDDGEGGRRKKGIGQKIKEKLPGAKKTDDQYGTTPTSTAYGGGHQAKPGMVDQMKEKLPGGRKEEPYGTAQHTTTTPGYGTGTGTGTGGYPTGTGGHQKPGMVEQMKEKIPGAHKEDPYSTGQHTTTAQPGYGTTGTAGQQQHEKKGMMEKIKEKLPGGNTTTR